jgi:hypothetical protein
MVSCVDFQTIVFLLIDLELTFVQFDPAHVDPLLLLELPIELVDCLLACSVLLLQLSDQFFQLADGQLLLADGCQVGLFSRSIVLRLAL